MSFGGFGRWLASNEGLKARAAGSLRALEEAYKAGYVDGSGAGGRGGSASVSKVYVQEKDEHRMPAGWDERGTNDARSTIDRVRSESKDDYTMDKSDFSGSGVRRLKTAGGGGGKRGGGKGKRAPRAPRPRRW